MSGKYKATARAHSNIAFIKYWGNTNHDLRLASNSSISMNLRDLYTTTTVTWLPDLKSDTLTINGSTAEKIAIERVSHHLDIIRQQFDIRTFADIESENNFPMGTGIASSASSFAALTLASITALGKSLPEKSLSMIARRGSGSASRSIPSGYVEWIAGESHETSYAEMFLDYDHWDLVDVIAIVSKQHKRTGSSAGHPTADTSILQDTRVRYADQRLQQVKTAIQQRDFEQFAEVVEEDSNLMHAVMMTSQPPLFYWNPLSLDIIKSVREWRLKKGIQVCYTLDAGPNVHCICVRDSVDVVINLLKNMSEDMELRTSPAGQGAYVIE